MTKKQRIIILILIVTAAILSGCDPSIYDLAGSKDIDVNYNPFEGLNIDMRQFINAKSSYERVLSDLEFMMSHCYFNDKLAAGQAYTILMSYGLADAAYDPADFESTQLQTKAELFDAIKSINVFANNFTDLEAENYSPEGIVHFTNIAIIHCKTMIGYFTT